MSLRGHQAHLLSCQRLAAGVAQPNAILAGAVGGQMIQRSLASARVGIWPASIHHITKCGVVQASRRIRLAGIDFGVDGLPDEFLQRLDAFPHAEIDRHAGIADPGNVGGVALSSFRAREAGMRSGRIDAIQIVEKAAWRDRPCRARSLPILSCARCRASFRRLPHAGARGDAPFDLGTEMADQALDRPGRRVAQRADRVAFDLLGRLPAAGRSRSTWASPFTMRVITRHIQPVPSRQGVHWPQLSCL